MEDFRVRNTLLSIVCLVVLYFKTSNIDSLECCSTRIFFLNSVDITDPRSPTLSAHNSSGGASGVSGGGMSENLDLMVDYWPLQTSSTMQIPNTKEKKEINKVSVYEKADLEVMVHIVEFL